MKIKEIIERVDRSLENTSTVSVSFLARKLGLGVPEDDKEEFGKRVKSHTVTRWYCTDTWVGMSVVYIDDEPLCVTNQTARKNPVEVYFVSKEAIGKLRLFILELLSKEESEYVDFLDMDEDVGEHLTISYSSQLLDDEGIYNGEKCQVVMKYDSRDTEKPQTIDIKKPNGEIINIPTEKFEIPFKII